MNIITYCFSKIKHSRRKVFVFSFLIIQGIILVISIINLFLEEFQYLRWITLIMIVLSAILLYLLHTTNNFIKDSVDKFKCFFEDSPSIILLVQQDNIIYANPSAVKMTGYSFCELYQMKWWDLAHEDMRELVKRRGLNRQLGIQEIERDEMKIRTKSGEVRWLDFSESKVMHEGKVAVLWNAYDIGERKKTEKKLEKLIALKDSMLEITHSIIEIDDIQVLYDLILDKALEAIDHANVGSILILKEDNNLAIAAQKGYDWEKMTEWRMPLEESLLWIVSEGNIDDTIIINDVQALPGAKVYNLVSDTENWLIRSSISAPIMIDENLYGMVYLDSKYKNVFNEEDREVLDYCRNQIQFALAKHLLYEKNINLLRYDKLTNVYNRRYFETVFEQDFAKVKRFKQTLSLVIFDLNGLKIVNDNYGHLVGDDYIKKFTYTLQNNLRESDLFARYGGDEFIAIIYNMDFEKVNIKMEEIVRKLKKSPLNSEEKEIICSFSYGIANYPDDAQDYKDLVKIADKRMYSYKAMLKSQIKT